MQQIKKHDKKKKYLVNKKQKQKDGSRGCHRYHWCTHCITNLLPYKTTVNIALVRHVGVFIILKQASNKPY